MHDACVKLVCCSNKLVCWYNQHSKGNNQASFMLQSTNLYCNAKYSNWLQQWTFFFPQSTCSQPSTSLFKKSNILSCKMQVLNLFVASMNKFIDVELTCLLIKLTNLLNRLVYCGNQLVYCLLLHTAMGKLIFSNHLFANDILINFSIAAAINFNYWRRKIKS